MACIIKGNDLYASGSSTISGFPISMVTNVNFTARSNLKRLDITFTIPQHRFVVNNTVLSELSEVYICVRNDRVPENYDDYQARMVSTGEFNGDSSDASAIFYFDDHNWEWIEGYTLYIRFFMVNTDGLVNYNPSGIYIYNLSIASETLSDNDWATISTVADNGNASDYWNIGDRIEVPITGTYAGTLKLQIWDFNHFDKSDGSGKAGICFGCRILPFMEGMHTWDTNTCGWQNADLRTNILQKVYSGFPQELKDVIKTVNTTSYPGNYGTNKITLQEKIFIPSIPEINLRDRAEPSADDGYQLPIFTDNASRKKTTDDGALHSWWSRTPCFGDNIYFHYVYYSTGDYGQVNNATTRDIGVAFCFNI